MRKLLIALVVLIALAMMPAAVSAQVTDTEEVTVSAIIESVSLFDIYLLQDNETPWAGWTTSTTGITGILSFNAGDGGYFAVDDSCLTTAPNNVWPPSGYFIGMVYESNSNDANLLDIYVTGNVTSGGDGTNYMGGSEGDLDNVFEALDSAPAWKLLGSYTTGYPNSALLVDNQAFDNNLPASQPGGNGISWYDDGFKLGQCVVSNDEAGTYSIVITFTAEEVTS